jgi:hypothetical protein
VCVWVLVSVSVSVSLCLRVRSRVLPAGSLAHCHQGRSLQDIQELLRSGRSPQGPTDLIAKVCAMLLATVTVLILFAAVI